MHNYCTPHNTKENFENFLIHRCNYILLSEVYCVPQVVKTPTIIFNNPVLKFAHPTNILHAASSPRNKDAEAWNWPHTSIYVTDWECVELYIHLSTRLYGVAFNEHEHQYRSKGPSLNCVCRPVRSVAPRSCLSKDTRHYSLPSASAQEPWPPVPGRLSKR